ncbi:hypothetical protein FNH22_17695 [Fulvivirga sp. M361]|uniref:hypothetical protein n=1 Tax=Fulvivirga sp. M361 TaxID=2594266 RepID=UPI00117B4291|nr:hypothetical protein [Fulvivirga sp. M361]TRX55995.1 hypothetical protein FNH22_17695 [Fulvivirga sp. M361]
MKKITGLLLLVLLCSFTYTSLNPIQRIKLSMVSRSVKDGHLKKVEADVYYNLEGKMVTYYTTPKPYITITNSKGDIQAYDQRQNVVFQTQNLMFSTETTQVYFFLQNKLADLGLSAMGFQMHNVSFDEGLNVTIWQPPIELSGQLKEVKLVHDKRKPIFLSYTDQNDQIVKKTYFYKYITLNGQTPFPTAITQIDYITPSDSTITKVAFSDILVNEQVDKSQLDFEIPVNARVVE